MRYYQALSFLIFQRSMHMLGIIAQAEFDRRGTDVQGHEYPNILCMDTPKEGESKW